MHNNNISSGQPKASSTTNTDNPTNSH